MTTLYLQGSFGDDRYTGLVWWKPLRTWRKVGEIVNRDGKPYNVVELDPW